MKLTDRIIAVREELKQIIEELEPNVHQFFPIELSMPKMKGEVGKYYTLVVGQYLDSFLPDESKAESFRSYEKYPGFYNAELSKKGLSGLAFREQEISGAHLWRERGFRETLTCFSNQLIAEVASAGLDIPTHYKMREY